MYCPFKLLGNYYQKWLNKYVKKVEGTFNLRLGGLYRVFWLEMNIKDRLFRLDLVFFSVLSAVCFETPTRL